MDEVEWKTVDYLLGFRVGRDGSIWTCRGNRGQITDNWKKLNTYRRPYGAKYVVVCLRPKPGDSVSCFYIHRLVLEAFIGPCPDGLEGCHYDGDTSNNSLDNLRWDTRVSNRGDSRRTGKLAMGERSGGSKLTEDQVVRIRKLYETGAYSQEEIGKQFGIAQTHVGDIIRRERWAHVK